MSEETFVLDASAMVQPGEIPKHRDTLKEAIRSAYEARAAD